MNKAVKLSVSLLSSSVLAITLTGCDHFPHHDRETIKYIDSSATSGPDTTPPAINSVTPTNGANAAEPGSAIGVSFSEDMLATSIDNASISLRSGGIDIPVTINFDAMNNEVTAITANQLALNTSYGATAYATISDLSGNSLVADHNWSFTTRDGIWSEPESMSGAQAANQPVITKDSQGNAVVLWKHNADDSLWTSRRSIDNSWSTPYQLSAGTYWLSIESLEMDDAGNAIAVWLETASGDTYGSPFAARYEATSNTWSTPQAIDAHDLGDASSVELAMNANGTAIAVWHQDDGALESVWSARYVPGSGWEPATLVEQDNTYRAYQPEITISDNGNAIATWNQRAVASDSRESLFSKRFDGVLGQWLDASLTLMENDDSGFPNVESIASDANGNVLVLWNFGYPTDLYSSFYNATAETWSGPELVEAEDLGSTYVPSVTFDESGIGYAIWAQDDGSRLNIWSNQYDPATGWETSTVIEASVMGFWAPSISIDSEGNIIVVWRYNSSGDGFWFNRFTQTDGWGSAQQVDIGVGVELYQQQVVYHDDGRATVFGLIDDLPAAVRFE